MGGVMMFFDRAMYVSTLHIRTALLTCEQAGNGKRTSSTSSNQVLRYRTLPNTPIDTLSDWSHTHHRNNENRRLLRAQAEMERHSGICRWYITYPDALGFHRFHNRTVRHTCAVWRLSHDHCGLRQQCTGDWAIYCQGTGSDKRCEAKC